MCFDVAWSTTIPRSLALYTFHCCTSTPGCSIAAAPAMFPFTDGSRSRSSSSSNKNSRCRRRRHDTIPSWETQAGMLLDRLNFLEMAFDPSRPGSESLVICKAVTDAFLVNAPYLRHSLGSDDLARALRAAWWNAIEHWNGCEEEPHSAADLHLTASWFQAWWAADDTVGGGNPTMSMYGSHIMLPGDWA